MTPLYASEKTAAKLLDLRPKQFLELVAHGALPPPIKIGKYSRWDVEQIRAIITGNAARPKERFEI